MGERVVGYSVGDKVYEEKCETAKVSYKFRYQRGKLQKEIVRLTGFLVGDSVGYKVFLATM